MAAKTPTLTRSTAGYTDPAEIISALSIEVEGLVDRNCPSKVLDDSRTKANVAVGRSIQHLHIYGGEKEGQIIFNLSFTNTGRGGFAESEIKCPIKKATP